jgi:Sec-independent protein translocase protein TatA
MNIFGIGELELVLIIVIALIVAGPKRMIQWMYVLGRFVARLRRIWAEAMVMVQRELDQAGVDVEVPKDIPTRGDLRKMTEKALKPFSEPMQEVVKEVKTVQTELQNTTRQTREQMNGIRSDLRKTPSTNGTGSPKPENNDTPFGTWSGTKKD